MLSPPVGLSESVLFCSLYGSRWEFVFFYPCKDPEEVAQRAQPYPRILKNDLCFSTRLLRKNGGKGVVIWGFFRDSVGKRGNLQRVLGLLLKHSLKELYFIIKNEVGQTPQSV